MRNSHGNCRRKMPGQAKSPRRLRIRVLIRPRRAYTTTEETATPAMKPASATSTARAITTRRACYRPPRSSLTRSPNFHGGTDRGDQSGIGLTALATLAPKLLLPLNEFPFENMPGTLADRDQVVTRQASTPDLRRP
jgi:hypothetical protein